MERQVLRDIGMTEQESNVYLALFKLGASTTTAIVKEAGIHASKVYSILDRLIEKGLVSTITKGKKKYYQASDPALLSDYLTSKKDAIDEQLTIVEDLIPQLRALREESAGDEEVQVFFGWKGLETAFRDMLRVLQPGEIQYVLGATYFEQLPIHNRFFQHFRRARDEHKIKSKVVFAASARGKMPSYENSSFTEIRYFEQNIPTSIDIYKDKVLISMMKKRPIVIMIKSQEIADSFMEYFKMLWKLAKPA